MDPVIQKDVRKLEAHVETIEQGLDCLKKDCSAWARKRAEHDLTGLMEDLRGVEADVSVMLTDCVSTGFQHGGNAPKQVFRYFREIFGCVDTLFTDLKQARHQLGETYIQPGTLNHLDVDWRRFEKLIGNVQGHVTAP